MEIIKPFIEKRLQLLNNSEPKNSIEDVVFKFNHLNGKITESSIFLIPYDGLKSYADKEKASQIVVNKIIDNSLFTENNLDIDEFNLVIFFSFDYLNHVDNCYIFNRQDGSITIQLHSLSGNLVLEKKLYERKVIIEQKIELKEHSDLYLFFDTETTGLPKNWKAPTSDLNNWPRLVQLAYLFYDGTGNLISKGDFIIKPEGFLIPIDSSNIHGISTERALNEGKSLVSILEHFNTLVSQATYLVAHNMAFDEKIVGAELLRNGMKNCIQHKNKICTMEGTTNFCAISGPYGYKWPKLSELHFKLFRKKFEEAHNAAIDITATARCFWELKKIGII
jgi:DNA polymerase-3 subunit epsilon